jgi:eukaryotic translation initiation factor 2C
MGVSYAPPAYYADRLCERGRCYLRKYYNPDRATKNDFDERKRKIQSQVREDRKAENKRLGRPEREKGHKKTDKEIKEDEEDREKVDAALKNALMGEIVARFNGKPVDDRAKRRMESHGKTMYWM